MPPIYATSTYAQSSPGEHQGFEYSRTHNPTRRLGARSRRCSCASAKAVPHDRTDSFRIPLPRNNDLP
ncbi:PLP-dependent transferase, partial [Stenotrophomonas sp. 3diitr2024]|uniref:PLP-dependent transferase n=1 Tax=Stenotrophomonas sp. 3diitr2024 TaxID=3345115 RepID=UPI0035CA9A97